MPQVSNTSSTTATYEDVAAAYKVSVSTVKRWVKRRQIPAIKLGHVVRFDLEEVNRHVRAKYRTEARLPRPGGF